MDMQEIISIDDSEQINCKQDEEFSNSQCFEELSNRSFSSIADEYCNIFMDLYFKDAMNAAMHTPYKIDRKSCFSEDSIGSEMIGSIDDISIKTMEIYDLKEKQNSMTTLSLAFEIGTKETTFLQCLEYIKSIKLQKQLKKYVKHKCINRQRLHDLILNANKDNKRNFRAFLCKHERRKNFRSGLCRSCFFNAYIKKKKQKKKNKS